MIWLQKTGVTLILYFDVRPVQRTFSNPYCHTRSQAPVQLRKLQPPQASACARCSAPCFHPHISWVGHDTGPYDFDERVRQRQDASHIAESRLKSDVGVSLAM